MATNNTEQRAPLLGPPTGSLSAARVLLLVALWPVLFTGCVAIPIGTMVASTEEAGRKTIRDTKLVSAELSAQIVDRGGVPALEVKAEGDYEETFFDRVLVRDDVRRKLLVLGLFPGVGRYALGDVTRTSAYDGEYKEAWKVNLWLGLYLSACATPISWFAEFRASWHGPIRGRVEEATDLALLGWAKSSKRLPSQERQYDEPPQTRPFSEALSGVSVVLRDEAGHFIDGARTNHAGKALFPIDSLPFLSGKSRALEISASGVAVPIKPVAVVLPARVTGRRLPEILWSDLRGYSYSEIYTDEGTIDFSKGRPAAAPRPEVEAVLLGQPPGRPEVLRVQVTAANEGRGALYRFIARTASDEKALDGQLLIFGKIEPGQTVTRTLELPVSNLSSFRSATSRLTSPVRSRWSSKN